MQSHDPIEQAESTKIDANLPCVLLVNLGSPTDPSPGAVRTYLREFLSDRSVIETHPLLWKPILEGIVLRFRPQKTGEKYSLIWMGEKGSPLVHYTKEQAAHLDKALAGQAHVEWAMRYGEPSLHATLQKIHDLGYKKLLLAPLYPQYTRCSAGTITKLTYDWQHQSRNPFDLRIVRSFPTHPGYLQALTQAIHSQWDKLGTPNFAAGDRLLLSYHSIPKAMINGGDPYALECEATTAAVAKALKIDAEHANEYIVTTYQSVFGPAEWLKPATIDTVVNLAQNGSKRVDVICPGFVSDCLETLEEIEMQNREAFTAAGGQEFNYIPWGNDTDSWLEALTQLVKESLVGW